MYYNIKIKSGDGEYCLESKDKDITQREMDIYFANLFNASKEFVNSIKKIEKRETTVKSIEEFTKQTSVSKQENIKENTSSSPNTKQDEFTQLVNPDIKAKSPDIEPKTEKKEISLTPLVFKPIPQEELAVPSEKKEATTPPEVQPIELVDDNNEDASSDDDFTLVENNEEDNTKKASSDDDFTLVEDDEEDNTKNASSDDDFILIKEETNTTSNNDLTLVEKSDNNSSEEQLILEEDNITDNKEVQIQTPKQTQPEIVSIKNDTKEEVLPEKDSETLEIVGLDEDKQEKEQKEKEQKQNALNKTIELVQNAVNNVDIASDETFNIDIPDTYSKSNIEDEITLTDEDFEEEEKEEQLQNTATNNMPVIQNNSSYEQPKSQNDDLVILDDENQETETLAQNDAEEINSIFSNESPFENPPESQNIIAAKEYPENKKALNLDFKTFLSNYETNGIIDEFLICAYYIKHISGQHSFNMKYINSKIFQATGKIADLSIVNGLVSGDFIKVFEVDGGKKYSISSTGEEYFMTHYQR